MGEEKGVLLLAMERVGETDTVLVFEAATLSVAVLLAPYLCVPVAETEGDLEVVMVRVQLGEACGARGREGRESKG